MESSFRISNRSLYHHSIPSPEFHEERQFTRIGTERYYERLHAIKYYLYGNDRERQD